MRIPSRRLIRRWVRDRYRDFGRHCARNQIRVLLIDSFVMTTLFYPALALHLQRSRPTFFSSLISSDTGAQGSTQQSLLGVLTDVFFPLPDRLLETADVAPFWVDERGWTARERPVDVPGWSSRLENRVDVLELVVGWTDVASVFERDQEGASRSAQPSRDQRALDLLRRELDAWNQTAQVSCVQEGDRCLVRPLPTSSDGVSQYSVFLRRTSDPNWVTSATTGWSRLLSRITASNPTCAMLAGDPSPTVYDVRVSDSDDVTPPSPSLPIPIAALYLVALGYLFWLMVRDRETHSRFGLAFTGITELAASSIMSFSLIGLFELRGGSSNDPSQPGVPWYILPFVVLVVGVENMSTLTRAVYAIPISRSVPDRIGYGMSNVGPRLFLTSLSDIAILTLIRLLIKLRPVEEFCTFASVLIFVDWFMIQTFYLTVLSIDCQRLELADLLRSKAKPKALGSPPAPTKPRNDLDAATPIKIATTVGSSSLKWGFERLWRARTTRGISLMLLLSSLTALYYFNETTQQGRAYSAFWQPSQTQPLRNPAQTTATLSAMHDAGSLGAALLRAVDSTASLAIARLPITKLVWPSDGYNISPASIVQYDLSLVRPLLPRIRPVFQFIKIVIIPQCATAFLLWLLLLFLLKDTQLLDARRDRADIQKTTATPPRAIAVSASPSLHLTLLPPSGVADIQRGFVDPSRSRVIVCHTEQRIALATPTSLRSLGRGTHLAASPLVAAWTHGQSIESMSIANDASEAAASLPTGASALMAHDEHVWAVLSDGSIASVAGQTISRLDLPAGRVQLVTSADGVHALITDASSMSVAHLPADLQPRVWMSARNLTSPVVSVSITKYRNEHVCLVNLENSSLQLFGAGTDEIIWSHQASSPGKCMLWADASTDVCPRCDRIKSSSITAIWSAGDLVDSVKLSEDSGDTCRCNAGRALRPSISSGDGNASRRLRAADMPTPSKTDATPPSRLAFGEGTPSKVNGSALLQASAALREYWQTPLSVTRGDWAVADDTLVAVSKTANGSTWQFRTVDLHDGTEAHYAIPRDDLDRAAMPASEFAAIAYSRIRLCADRTHRTLALLLGNRSALITLPPADSSPLHDPHFLSPNLLTPMKAG